VPAEILPFSTPRWVTIPENLIASCPLSRHWNWMGETHPDIIGNGTNGNPTGPRGRLPRYYNF